MQRIEQLSNFYMDKERLISIKCDSNLGADLISLSNSASALSDSEELYKMNFILEELEYKNTGDCRLW